MSFKVYKKLQYYLRIHILMGQYPAHQLDMPLVQQRLELLIWISMMKFYLEMTELLWNQDQLKISPLVGSRRVAQNQEHQMVQVLYRNKHYLCSILGNSVRLQLWLRTHQQEFYNFLNKEWEETNRDSQLIFMVWAGNQEAALQVKSVA